MTTFPTDRNELNRYLDYVIECLESHAAWVMPWPLWKQALDK